MTRVAIFLAAIALLSGCATNKSPSMPDESMADNGLDQAFWQDFRRVSVETRDELRLLAKSQNALMLESATPAQHEQRFFQSTYVPEGFERVVDFHFAGKVRKAAEAIAKMAGYDFRVLGTPIPREPVVSITLETESLINALHELGMYTGDSIKVEVLEAKQRIDFKYNNG